MSRLTNPTKALREAQSRLVDVKIAAKVGRRGEVLEVLDGGIASVNDGSGGCLLIVDAGNVKKGDTIQLDNLLQVGEASTGVPISSDVPPSTKPCPDGEMCDLAIGGAAPDPPESLTLTPVGTDEIDLAWEADPCSADFTIERAEGDCDSNSGFSVIATGVTDTTYADTGLTPGTTYAYRVSARGQNESESDMSDCESAPTGVTPGFISDAGERFDLATGEWIDDGNPAAESNTDFVYSANSVGAVDGDGGTLNYVGPIGSVSPTDGSNVKTINGDGYQAHMLSIPGGDVANQVRRGKGPTAGVVIGLEIAEPPGQPTGTRYTLVARDASTFAVLATLSDSFLYDFVHASTDGFFADFDNMLNDGPFFVAPDTDGTWWICTKFQFDTVSDPDKVRIFQIQYSSGTLTVLGSIDLHKPGVPNSWGPQFIEIRR